MAIFDRLDRMVSRTVDTINAERFILTPMKHSPNGRPVYDDNRPIVEAVGVFDYVDVDYGIELGVRKSYREANDLRALQSGREPVLSVDRRYFPRLDDEPRQSAVVEFPDRPDLPRFEVVSVKRDGQSRLLIQLVHRGSQA